MCVCVCMSVWLAVSVFDWLDWVFVFLYVCVCALQFCLNVKIVPEAWLPKKLQLELFFYISIYRNNTSESNNMRLRILYWLDKSNYFISQRWN